MLKHFLVMLIRCLDSLNVIFCLYINTVYYVHACSMLSVYTAVVYSVSC